MRYRLRTLLGLMVIVGAVCAWVVPPLARGPKIFLIESETPGTLVFSGDRYLGETPLWFHESDFPGYNAGALFQGCWTMSSQGVGLWDDTLDRPSRDFWFRAPESAGHKFFHYETPFGAATRTDGEPHWSGSGGSDWLGQTVYRNGYKVHFRKASSNEGLIVEVRAPAKMPRDSSHVPVSIRIYNPTKLIWRAVDDPHYINVHYTSPASEGDWSEWIHSQAEATQLDPGEVCVVEGELERKQLDRPWWVVFADVRYRPAGTPIEAKRSNDFQRCSNGVLVQFED